MYVHCEQMLVVVVAAWLPGAASTLASEDTQAGVRLFQQYYRCYYHKYFSSKSGSEGQVNLRFQFYRLIVFFMPEREICV